MSPAKAKTHGPEQAWAELSQQWVAAYKANLDTLLAIANAALAGAEKMRMAQLATDVETQTQNRQVAKEVASSSDVPGLVAAQSHLSGAYSEGYVRYWSMMLEAAQQTQAEIARILAARAAEMNEEMRKAFGGAGAGTIPALPEQMAQMIEVARSQQEAMLKAVSSLATLAPRAPTPGAERRAH
jgi:hypothetical protein